MSDMIERLNAALEDRYEIQRELGEGGMATVYLARDLKHNRDVALKVLRPELAAVVGAERFLAEIQTTANLQHPHILPLFDSGEADSFLFYVMPYVEGESLRERIQKEHQLPVEEALEIAENVAAALQYAHDQGVVHRDVKPANILLSRGKPLVADFGIALALSEAGGGRITETGLSLGTPHYMSPEQAAGERTLDRRSDVYALGCVLYEMLTGQPPYGGPTAQAVLGRILTGDPTPPTEHRKAIPANVEHAVLRALEKLPADRFESAAEFVRALKNPSFRHGVGAGAGSGDPAAETGRWRRIALAATAVALLLAGLQLWSLLAGADGDPHPERHRIRLGSGIDDLPGSVSFGVALPPDGSGILFPDSVGEAEGESGPTYWWKRHDRAEAERISGMDGAVAPAFSPDGRWVVYLAGAELRKQPLRGGTTVVLADSVNPPGLPALTWLSSGTILFESAGPVVERISEDGRNRDTVATEAEVGWPLHMSPLSGGAALVSSCNDFTCTGSRLFLLDLDRDTVAALADDVLRAWQGPGSRIVYVDRRGAVFAAALRRDELSLEPPVPLFDGVGAGDRTAEMVLGADGSLVYLRGGSTVGGRTPVWVDRDGEIEVVDPEWVTGDFLNLALSPDDDRMAIEIVTDGVEQIWVKELPEGPLTRLTVGGNRSRRPAWTPDGRLVAFIVQDVPEAPFHASALRADGSSARADTLATPKGDHSVLEVRPARGPEGVLVRVGDTGDGAADLGLADPDSDTVAWLLDSGFNEHAVDLSPDGRWLAYVSDRSGQREVYVRPFPDVANRRIQVSIDGGTEPLWAHNGRELFYRDRRDWMVAASLRTEPELAVEGRERLFDARIYRGNSSYRVYDVARDDQRFAMLRAGGPGGDRGDLILVRNWFGELDDALSR